MDHWDFHSIAGGSSRSFSSELRAQQNSLTTARLFTELLFSAPNICDSVGISMCIVYRRINALDLLKNNVFSLLIKYSYGRDIFIIYRPGRCCEQRWQLSPLNPTHFSGSQLNTIMTKHTQCLGV